MAARKSKKPRSIEEIDRRLADLACRLGTLDAKTQALGVVDAVEVLERAAERAGFELTFTLKRSGRKTRTPEDRE